MKAGQQISFIVSRDIAGRMDRVIMINDGCIVSKHRHNGDVMYTVERT